MTTVFTGTAICGCVLGVAIVERERPPDLPDTLARWRGNGWTVERWDYDVAPAARFCGAHARPVSTRKVRR